MTLKIALASALVFTVFQVSWSQQPSNYNTYSISVSSPAQTFECAHFFRSSDSVERSGTNDAETAAQLPAGP